MAQPKATTMRLLLISAILSTVSSYSTSPSIVRIQNRRDVSLLATPRSAGSSKAALGAASIASDESAKPGFGPKLRSRARAIVPNFRAIAHDLSPAGASIPTVPTYKKLLTLASTTVLIWLSEPLLSLVDTTVVGYSQGSSAVVQLASMGPATTMMDTLIYMTYFLSLGTTNLLTKGMAEKDWRGLQKSTSNILALASVIGFGLMALVWFASPFMLGAMAGSSATSELLTYAVNYSRIRAIAAPLCIMGLVAQSFNLATMNVSRCAWAVALASTLNIVGDLALARFGVVGAATATAVASSVSSIFLLTSVKKRLNIWRQNEVDEWRIKNSTKDKLEQMDVQAASSEGVYVSAPPQRIPFFSWPDRKALWQLATISGPLGFSMWAKMGCYAALTVAATRFGVVPLAVNNIMMRLFYFFSAFGDSMGLLAQAFLPASVYPPNPKSYRATARRLVAMATLVSLVVGKVSAVLLQGAGRALARDGAMIELLQSQAPLLASVVFLHPLVVLAEGTVIGTRDFRNLILTYVGAIGIHSFLMATAPSFDAVWKAFVALQLVRLSGFRIWRRKSRELLE